MRSSLFAAAITLSAVAVVSPSAAAPLSLVAIGDWGGDSDSEPTTAAQIAAAAGMSKIADETNAEAILLLGDNFYTHGVSSSTSSRFNETFEQVYDVEHFGKLPFHVIAGNHDHYGNVQAQLDYHGSERWNFPSLYYTLPFTYTSSSSVKRSVDIIMVDTVELVGECTDGGDWVGCPRAVPAHKLGAAESQWQWLQEQLDASKADFLWVAGHFPIYSAGSDGTTADLVDRLLPMLKKAGAHYISGHDHMHEHILYEGVHMFVTGPGRFCCYEPVHWDTVPSGAMQFMISGNGGRGKSVGPAVEGGMQAGFSTMEFDDSLQIKMYKEDGTPVYVPSPIEPRSL